MNNRAKARLAVRLWLDCPSCDASLDLMQDVPELIDDNQMWDLIDDREAWKNPGYVFDCPKCDKHIVLSEVEY